MTAQVFAARPAGYNSALAYRRSDKGMRHIPVPDDTGQVAGMATQSDLFPALCKRIDLTTG